MSYNLYSAACIKKRQGQNHPKNNNIVNKLYARSLLLAHQPRACVWSVCGPYGRP